MRVAGAGAMRSILILVLCARSASAGSLDLDLGLQATKTEWPADHGGGTAFVAGYWFRPWIGASFINKEQYVTVDDRFLSYYSLNTEARVSLGDLWLTGTLGAVHQHEESRAAVMASPTGAVFGVGDGIRHRMAGRAGVSLALPLRNDGHGITSYIALDLDGTVFTDSDKGPPWMASAGLSLGFTYDLTGPK
jgi:hypothetical protein